MNLKPHHIVTWLTSLCGCQILKRAMSNGNEDLAPGVQAAFDMVAKVEDELKRMSTDCRARTDQLQSRQAQDWKKFEKFVSEMQVC